MRDHSLAASAIADAPPYLADCRCRRSARLAATGSTRSPRPPPGSRSRDCAPTSRPSAALLTGAGGRARRYLWDLASARAGAAGCAARRPIRTARFDANRSTEAAAAVAATPGRSRGDAAAAPHEGGGGAADRARRYRRRLAGHAGHARADRARRHGGRCGGRLLAGAMRERGKLVCRADRDPARRGSGYIVLAMGKMGAFELNYSSDIDLIVFFDPACRRWSPGTEPAPFFVRLTRGLVKLLQERTADGYVFRVDLRLRPDPGLHPDRDLDRGRARLLREPRAELGARRDDQGAALRRRHRGRRGVAERARRRSSGANISTSRRSPTCTR